MVTKQGHHATFPGSMAGKHTTSAVTQMSLGTLGVTQWRVVNQAVPGVDVLHVVSVKCYTVKGGKSGSPWGGCTPCGKCKSGSPWGGCTPCGKC